MNDVDDEVRRTVRSIVVELAPTKGVEASRELNLATDLGYHSLALLEAIVAIEEELGISLTDDGSATFITTIGDMEDYIAKLAAQRRADEVGSGGHG